MGNILKCNWEMFHFRRIFMDLINAAILNRFNSAKTYKEILNAIKLTRKVFVPKRKLPGVNDFGIAAYADKIALITIDRNPLEGFDMDYIIFDAFDANQFFNEKLEIFTKKYKLKGIDLKVSESRLIRFNIDNKFKLSIPKG
jgi:hypothetical protein